MNTPSRIRVLRGEFRAVMYVSDVQPQNDTFARDSLIRSETVNPAAAMILPRDVALLIVARWDANRNDATPGYAVESV